MIIKKSWLFVGWMITACMGLPAVVLSAPGTMPPVSGRVDRAIDGASFRMADGRIVRLTGLVSDRATGLDESCRRAETDALNGLLAGEGVALTGVQTSGWDGHPHAQAYRARDGLWIEAAMLESGYARFYSYADDPAKSRQDVDLLAAEARARAAQKGLWRPSSHCYTVSSAASLSHGGVRDSFAMVAGRIVHVAETQSGLYLDFGADWRHAFSVLIDPASARLFRSGEDNPRDWPRNWEGRNALVRGWIFNRMGEPTIRIDHPAQIEILPGAPTG